MWLREENKQEAPTIKPDKFDPANWTEWSKQFVTYLSHTKGVQFVLLDYVVREDPPPGPLADMTPRDQVLYNYPLAGCHFQEDNMMVYSLLSDLISGKTGFVWVQPFNQAQNGRAAWLALLEHYEGGGQKEKCMAAALATIKPLHYRHESVFSYHDLNGTNEDITPYLQVKQMLDKIEVSHPHVEVARHMFARILDRPFQVPWHTSALNLLTCSLMPWPTSMAVLASVLLLVIALFAQRWKMADLTALLFSTALML